MQTAVASCCSVGVCVYTHVLVPGATVCVPVRSVLALPFLTRFTWRYLTADGTTAMHGHWNTVIVSNTGVQVILALIYPSPVC